MSSAINGKTMKYVHIIVMFVLMIGIGLLPPFGQITELGMKILGIFIGIMYAWIFIDLLWPSLFGFFAIALTGYMDIGSAIISGFGNYTFLLILIVSLFAESLNQIGLTNTIAYWILSKKIFIGKPWLLIVCLVCTTALLGLLGGGFAAMFLMWAVALDICKLNGIETKNRLATMLIGLILYASISGGNVIPFQSGVILYSGFFTPTAEGLAIPDLQFLFLGIIYLFACLLIMLLIAKVVLRIDASKFNITAEMCEKFAEYKSNKYQKAGLVLLVAYFAALILPLLFPAAPGMAFLSKVGVFGMSILYVTIFVIWRTEEDKPVINIMQCFQNGIPWSVMVLLAVTFPLSAAMESADTGIIATINTTVAPILSTLGPTGMLIVSMLVLGLITQVMHNIVLAAMFFPILTPIYINLGGNPYTLFFAIYFTLQCAYVTPAASMQAGFIFGHEHANRKDAYLFGLMFMIVSFIVLLLLTPICNMIFPAY